MGGESIEFPISLMYDGIASVIAKSTNALVILMEHRYYGESIPLPRTDVKNLKYLSSQQALADAAALIKYIKTAPQYAKSKVVAFGTSYSGNLAAWMRLIYPTLVNAALASSAPVLAKLDFYEYLEKVTEDYLKHGIDGCVERIRNIFKRYADLFKTEEGIEILKLEENICPNSDLKNILNKQLFFDYNIEYYAFISQYGLPVSIMMHCKHIMQNTTYILPEFKKYLEIFFPFIWDKNNSCYNIHFNAKNWPWNFQTCTEFGHFRTTSSDKHPFTENVPLSFFTNMCIKFFGSNYDSNEIQNGINHTNLFYGGRRPNVTNVLFVNGDMDPWSNLGILNDLSPNAPAILIPNSSHCYDWLPESKNDWKELRDVQARIKKNYKEMDSLVGIANKRLF